MKHRELHAIAHNYADSLASGMCFVLDVYHPCEIFSEAAANPQNQITVDFLKGTIETECVSENLQVVVASFRAAFPEFCAKHSANAEDFTEFRVCFSTGHKGNRYRVTIADKAGKSTSISYKGIPGRREKMLDDAGRIRRNVTVHHNGKVTEA